MEFVHGHRLSDIIHAIERYGSTSPGAAPRALDIDRGVRNLANACLRQLFVTGFFHADPHPGNIFLLDDGSVMFIDFGIFCDLLPERRETLASYIENVAIGNFEAGFRHFRRLLIPTEATDHRKLKRDVLAIFRRWHDASVDVDTPLSERHAGRYFGEFITAMRNNRVQMSLDTLLFWRALITLDATALRFRRSFDLLGIMREFFENVRPSPLERIVGAIGDRHLISSFWQSLPAAPANIASLSRQIVEGGFRMPVRDAPQRREKERAKSYALAVALAFVAVSALVLGLAAV
jgi:ubiquinone biosynthesis protein